MRNIYDPRYKSPDKMFDPNFAAVMGARIDEGADVKDEKDTAIWSIETACVPSVVGGKVSDCTWKRLWRRKFRVFNCGTDDPDKNRPVTVNNPAYNCSGIYYDECVIEAAASQFTPGR